MKKVSFLDKQLINKFYNVFSVIALIVTFTLSFVCIADKYKIAIFVVLIIIMIIIYFKMWYSANKLDSVKLEINNSTLEVKVGNIFDEDGFKVIGFNEYFDTVVDNKIISEKSLNGQYLNKKVDDIEELDKLINDDEHINQHVIELNSERKVGKKKRYQLGTVLKNDEYFLMALSRFDADNRANLTIKEYVSCLLNFWNEVDILYEDKSVALPILGTGITRFKECENITDQELLELIIWTFRKSRLKFTYPSTVKIIVYEGKKDKINFYKLRGLK